MNVFAQNDLVAIRNVVCGVVYEVNGDKVTVSRSNGQIRQTVHYRDVRKLELGDNVTVNTHPTVGEIIDFKPLSVCVKRPDGKGGFMTHWVSIFGIVPVEDEPLVLKSPSTFGGQKFEFEIVLETDTGDQEWHRAELVGSSPTTPYGYGDTAWEAIIDLCESLPEVEDLFS